MRRHVIAHRIAMAALVHSPPGLDRVDPPATAKVVLTCFERRLSQLCMEQKRSRIRDLL